MAINDLFDIQLTMKLDDTPLATRLLQPTDFFDMDFVVARDVEEIRCTSPWKYDFLQDYLGGDDSSRDGIRWLQIDIIHRKNGERRRVTEQYWGEHWISVDWVKTPFSEPTCVVLLHLKEFNGESWQHVKLQLSPMTFAIRGHWVTSGGHSDNQNPHTLSRGTANVGVPDIRTQWWTRKGDRSGR